MQRNDFDAQNSCCLGEIQDEEVLFQELKNEMEMEANKAIHQPTRRWFLSRIILVSFVGSTELFDSSVSYADACNNWCDSCFLICNSCIFNAGCSQCFATCKSYRKK
jgi:hypothetical protein